MRSREEIEDDAYNKTMSQSPSLETNRLLYLIIEILLDIRDQNIYESHWGVYCPQHRGSWDTDPTGRIAPPAIKYSPSRGYLAGSSIATQ